MGCSKKNKDFICIDTCSGYRSSNLEPKGVQHLTSHNVSDLMLSQGYKTKRTLFKGMKNCSIECCEGVITICPSFHEKAEAWSGKGIEKSDYVVLAANSPEADIGAALRLAFSRCKGSK